MSQRILFVDHAGVLGGGELSLLTIATAFRDQSSVVLFEDGPFKSRLQAAGVAVEILPLSESVRRVSRDGGIANDILAAPGLLKQCIRLARAAKSYDVIYTNSQKSMVVGAIAGLIARKPVVWHLRDLLDEAHFSGGHIRIGVGISNRLVTLVIANSQATADAFVSAGGKSEIVRTIYNGIESTPFENVDAAARDRIRTELGVKAGELVVGSFSRLADWKGQHVLLESIRDEPTLHVLLVGDALFAPDQSYKSLLKSLTHRYGMESRVHFLGFRNDVADLMSACDIVSHSSTAPEPFGRVIVEGMFAGKAVVATDAGGASELIVDGETGMLVPPNDATAMRGALVELVQRASFREVLAQAGRESALQRFSSEQMIDSIRSAVASLV